MVCSINICVPHTYQAYISLCDSFSINLLYQINLFETQKTLWISVISVESNKTFFYDLTLSASEGRRSQSEDIFLEKPHRDQIDSKTFWGYVLSKTVYVDDDHCPWLNTHCTREVFRLFLYQLSPFTK